MCDATVWFFDVIANINGLEFIKAFASLAVAVIAFLALKNWKRQDKAKREAEFLDALIEAVHTYIAEMPKPITLLEMAKTGMESYAPTWEKGDETDKAMKGAIAYFQKKEARGAECLREALENVQPATIKLRSLAAKGQMFKFDNYEKCQNAVATLTWQFNRIEAFMAVIGSPSWNWEHPEVLRCLKDVMVIDPNDIRESIKRDNIALIEFVRDNYRRIYG